MGGGKGGLVSIGILNGWIPKKKPPLSLWFDSTRVANCYQRVSSTSIGSGRRDLLSLIISFFSYISSLRSVYICACAQCRGCNAGTCTCTYICTNTIANEECLVINLFLLPTFGLFGLFCLFSPPMDVQARAERETRYRFGVGAA